MSINWLVFIMETGSVLCEVGTEIQNVCIREIHVASHSHVASRRSFTAEARVHSSANTY
jgi:hypothetical protein